MSVVPLPAEEAWTAGKGDGEPAQRPTVSLPSMTAAGKDAESLKYLKRLNLLDVNKDGTLDAAELEQGIRQLVEAESNVKSMRVTIIILSVTLLLLVAAMFGVSFAAAMLAKDTRVSPDGYLTQKDGRAVQVGGPAISLDAGFNVVGTSSPAAGLRRLLQADSSGTGSDVPELQVPPESFALACQALAAGRNTFTMNFPYTDENKQKHVRVIEMSAADFSCAPAPAPTPAGHRRLHRRLLHTDRQLLLTADQIKAFSSQSITVQLKIQPVLPSATANTDAWKSNYISEMASVLGITTSRITILSITAVTTA